MFTKPIVYHHTSYLFLWVKKWILVNGLGLGLFLFFGRMEAIGQVQVYAEQGVQFGSFVAGGSGGTLTITFEEERTATGDILLVNQGEIYQPVIFGIEAPFGSTINILNGPDVILQGTNGGEIILSLGESSRGPSFISEAVPPDRNYVSISTSLTVGAGVDNPPGNYGGNLSITVVQE